MFSTSTQLKYWIFPNVAEIERLREEANQRYVKDNSAIYTLNDPETEGDELLKSRFFLDAAEESKIRRHYEYVLRDFCLNFVPPMPRYVMGTAMAYFKRIYLHNSVMDYHPRDIVFTCVYLACKVEEFNLSIHEFIANLQRPSERSMELILSQELQLMQMLHYHLTVHNPYRPVEGLLIDIKTRCPELPEPDRLRRGIDEFLDKAIVTDVSLLFAPSQIALTAILTSGSNLGLNIDSYVANKLIEVREALMNMVDHVQKVRGMVKALEPVDAEEVRRLKEKLEQCRNQDNNPDSELYRQKGEEVDEDDVERRELKQQRRVGGENGIWELDL